MEQSVVSVESVGPVEAREARPAWPGRWGRAARSARQIAPGTRPSRGRPRHGRLRRLALGLAGVVILAAATPAMADEYDPDKAGHPLRILAYVIHPIGVAIDYLLMRPAHWLVSHEPVKTIFGHED